MNKGKLVRSKLKDGAVLPLVLIVVVILLAAGMGLLGLGFHSRIFAVQTASEIAARCAVDAGLTKAVFEMNRKLKTEPWDDSSLPEAADEALPNCDALYSYTVTGDLASGYSIQSIGKSGRAQRQASSDLKLQGPFEYAIFVDADLTLKPGTLVDGYNSSDATKTDVELKTGTNSQVAGSVTLSMGVTVDGDVLVGEGGDVASVIRDLGATTGERYAITETVQFPPVTAPNLPDMGMISVHGKTVTIGPADTGTYTKIAVKRAANPGILEIAGGDVVLHITGDVDLGQDCEIIVRPGSSLVLYLDGNLTAGNNSGINNQSVPASFKLYGTGGPGQAFDIKAKEDFSGAVYAPNADVVINAGGDVYGSFLGSSFQMNSGGNFYYDEMLKEASVNDETVRFVMKTWFEQ
jgi:hypothetical protein